MQYKNFFLVCLLFVTALTGCRKSNAKQVPFFIYITIPAGLNMYLTHHFPITDIPGLQDEVGVVVGATPVSIRITPIVGASDVNFIQNAYLDMLTVDNTPMEMGYMLNAPIADALSLTLFPSIVDVKDQIIQPTFDTELKLVLREVTTAPIQLRIDLVVELETE